MGIFRQPKIETPPADAPAEPGDETARRRQLAIRRRRARSGRDSTVSPTRGDRDAATGSAPTPNAGPAPIGGGFRGGLPGGSIFSVR